MQGVDVGRRRSLHMGLCSRSNTGYAYGENTLIHTDRELGKMLTMICRYDQQHLTRSWHDYVASPAAGKQNDPLRDYCRHVIRPVLKFSLLCQGISVTDSIITSIHEVANASTVFLSLLSSSMHLPSILPRPYLPYMHPLST